jgi:Ca2+-binding RTX toxin-like protein
MLQGGKGTDTLVGGSGLDVVDYSERRNPVTVNLTPGASNAPSTGNGVPGENDSIKDVEDINGGLGNDTLTGNAGVNTVFGDRGNDLIDPGPGNDSVNGGDGNDTYKTQDGQVDVVTCSRGADTGDLDDIDVRSGSCDGSTFNLRTVAAPVTAPSAAGAADKSKPSLTFKKFKTRIKRKTFLKSGVSGQVTANEASSLVLGLTGRLRIRRGAVAASVGDIVLSTKRLPLTAGKTKTFRVKISKKYQRALPKRFKLKLRFTATDAAGNVKTYTKTISVR